MNKREELEGSLELTELNECPGHETALKRECLSCKEDYENHFPCNRDCATFKSMAATYNMLGTALLQRGITPDPQILKKVSHNVFIMRARGITVSDSLIIEHVTENYTAYINMTGYLDGKMGLGNFLTA